MKKIAHTLLALTLVAFNNAKAAPSTTIDACWEQSESHADVPTCLVRELAKERKKLDKLVESTLAQDKTTDTDFPGYNLAKQFNQSQKAFNKYVQIQCDYVAATFTTGNGGGDAHLGCQIDMTRERIKLLSPQK
jgi:uncharacterized protein YecT (DUF1311 family)